LSFNAQQGISKEDPLMFNKVWYGAYFMHARVDKVEMTSTIEKEDHLC